MQNKRFELPAAVPEGARDNTLYRYASSLWGRAGHIDPADLLKELEKANQECCKPPLPDADLERICASVTSKPEGPSPAYLARAKQREGGGGGEVIEATAAPIGEEVYPNDMSIAENFAKGHAHLLRAVHEGGKYRWYAYDGKRWTTEGGPAAAQYLINYVIHLIAVAKKEYDAEDEAIQAAIGAGAELEDLDGTKLKAARARYMGFCSYQSANKRRTLLADAANRPEVCAGVRDFDRDTNLLNVGNGTIEFEPFRFRAHDPADMCTRLAGCDYNPDASQATWTVFLDGAFRGATEDVLPFLKVSMGLALRGDTSPERFYLLYGEPRAGKSTFADALSAALGDYAHTSSPSTFAVSNRNAQGPAADYLAMEGARLLFCNEWPKDKRFDAAFVKSLTGNDPITARGLFSNEERNIQPHATLTLNTNYLPRTTDTTIFSSRRAVVIPFVNTRAPSEQDRSLKSRLRAPEALSGVLNWLLDGWRVYAGTRALPEVPSSCEKAIARYAMDSDNVARFVNDECEVSEGSIAEGPLLYDRYRDYCDRIGESPASAQGFYRDLKSKGHPVNDRERVNGKQTRAVHGLRYRTDATA
ncbi:phage/plasmid primase, P4 family [Paratractidigestivibacter sp.]|uniref:phage/plasmid primase, P4 family n=1 Tax=Paratractidigestivibacter sp. TaxID=2847316 RepID=UPI002AC9A2C7|nr:phage/plasmid primase, P4 family [Paratractidigestivibacter sp.]